MCGGKNRGIFSLSPVPGGQPESDERYLFYKTLRELIILIDVHLEGTFVNRYTVHTVNRILQVWRVTEYIQSSTVLRYNFEVLPYFSVLELYTSTPLKLRGNLLSTLLHLSSSCSFFSIFFVR